MLAKPVAFFLRDLRLAASYRLAFAQGLFSVVFGLASMNFLSRLVNEGQPESLEAYGSDYFSFVLIGLSLALFGQAVARQFPSLLRSAQVTGTLEVMIGSRTGLPAFLAYSSLYGIFFAGLQFAASLVLGALVLGANLNAAELFGALVVIALTTASFAGVGIFAAAFVIWFKQSEPLTAFFLTASLLASGVFYPTAVLPGWLEALSPLLPLTHSAEALRHALLEGTSLSLLSDAVLALAGFSLLLPTSLFAMDYAVRRAKVAGSLAQY